MIGRYLYTDLKIRSKLLVSFLIISIVPFLVVGLLTTFTFIKSLSDQTFDHLESMREVKKHQIEHIFEDKRKNMQVLMQTVASLKQAAYEKLLSIQEMKKAEVESYFNNLKRDVRVLAKNSSLFRAIFDFSTAYDDQGKIDKQLYQYFEEIKYSNSLRHIKKEYGYDDLLLISDQGRVVFSLNKGSELGKSVTSFPLKETGLGRVFPKAIKKLSIQDFEKYSPSNRRHIAFVGSPITDAFGNLYGILVVKIDKKELNTIVQRGQQHVSAGESFLLAKNDFGVFNRSDRFKSNQIFGSVFQEADFHDFFKHSSQEEAEILTNKDGIQIYRHEKLNIEGLNWALITTMKLEQIIAPKLAADKKDYFEKYIDQYGYLDLLLITPQGEVFYSVSKNPEYRSSLVSGLHASSTLGRLFKKAMKTRQLSFIDFQPEYAQDSLPRAFIAQPVISHDKVELVVALQLSISTINEVMLERSGMGETGETYLVGSDQYMRSDSFLDPENYSIQSTFLSRENKRVDTIATGKALSGQTSREYIRNYNDNEVLSAFSPVKIWDTTWALIAEIDANEALGPVRLIVWTVVLFTSVGVAIIVLVCFLVAKRISNPINELTEASEAISKGNTKIVLNQEILKSKDEIGVLANSFHHMTRQLNEAIHELKEEIAERKRTEKQLSSLQNLLKNIIDSMPSVLVGVDVEGRVMQWNQQAQDATGISAEQAQGMRLDKVYPILAGEMERIKKSIENKTVHRDERIPIGDHEGPRFLDVTVYPLTANSVEGAVIRLDDVTDRVRIEEMMIQTEKMMSVGGLAAGMAHEINNPLGIILQGIQNTFRRFSPKLKGNVSSANDCGVDLEKVSDYMEQRNIIEYLNGIQEAGKRAANIVENMLDFSRQSSSVRQELNINEVLEKAIELAKKDYDLDSKYDFQHIKIKRDYQDNIPAIFCSKTEIEQVMLNLLKNSAQAMHSKKKDGYKPIIAIRTRNNNKFVNVEIEDNGPGMSAETRKRIFEPFYTTKPVGIGTGLGLSVSYFIVTRNHGGSLTVSSEPGESATFKINLPFFPENQ